MLPIISKKSESRDWGKLYLNLTQRVEPIEYLESFIPWLLIAHIAKQKSLPLFFAKRNFRQRSWGTTVARLPSSNAHHAKT